MNEYAPIIVLVYDRLEHFKKCINSLLSNEISKHSTLYVVSDAAYKDEDKDKVNKVREFALSIIGFKEVRLFFRENNLGAHDSCEQSINEALNTYDSFIILEDDIIVATNFLQYMNDGLIYYKEEKCVFSICGYSPPFQLPSSYNKGTYFYPCNSPWGFATWKDRWQAVDFDFFDRYSELKKDKQKYKAFCSIGFYIKGILQADSRKEIVAGDLRIYYHMFQHNMCSVFPTVSKTQNWGFDGSGEHCGNKKALWAKPKLDARNEPTKFTPFDGYDENLLETQRNFMDKINGGILAKYLKYTWVHSIWKLVKEHIV